MSDTRAGGASNRASGGREHRTPVERRLSVRFRHFPPRLCCRHGSVHRVLGQRADYRRTSVMSGPDSRDAVDWGWLPADVFARVVEPATHSDIRSFRLVCRDWCRNVRLTVRRFSVARIESSFQLSTVTNIFPKLEEITVHCDRLQWDIGALAPVQTLSALRRLEIRNPSCCYSLENLSDLRQLTELRILQSAWEPGGWQLTFVEGLQSLRVLELSETKDLSLLSRLRNLSSLTRLTLRYCEGIKGRDLTILENLSRLKSLELNGFSYDLNLLKLGALSRLEVLNVAYCQKVGGGLFLSEACLCCGGLLVLDLGHCEGLKDEDFATLTELRNLRALNIAHCRIVSDSVLLSITCLKSLKWLNISGLRTLSSHVLEALQDLEELEALVAHYCPLVTNDVLKAWTNLEKLKVLGCAWCHLITDVGIEHVGRLRQLTHFDVTGCDKITKEALIHIQRLPNLAYFGARHTEVIKEGVELSLKGQVNELSNGSGLESASRDLCELIFKNKISLLSESGVVDSWLKGI